MKKEHALELFAGILIALQGFFSEMPILMIAGILLIVASFLKDVKE
jgi:hypothetical protein